MVLDSSKTPFGTFILTYYLQTHDEISMELLILENSVHVQSNIFFWQERYRTKIVLQTS